MGRAGAGGLTLAVAVALAAGPAVGQDAQPAAQRFYQPNRAVEIPVNPDKLAKLPDRPKELQLYWSFRRGAWQPGRKLPLDGLDDLADGRKGFAFKADADGEYEFSVQFHYPDGSARPPKPDELQPMLDVVFDTTIPEVRVRAVGTGVEWSASDANLDPAFAELQAKYPHWTEWKTVSDRTFTAADRYAWKLRPGEALDVRVRARDRAGNDGWSRVVRVPGDGPGVETSFPRAGAGAGGGPGEWLPPVGGAGAAPQPRIEYVRTREVSVDYTLSKVGRSGIKAVQLWVQAGDAGWPDKPSQEYPVNIPGGKADQQLSLPYTVPADGVYGFYVAPESVSGQKAPPPRRTDPPMLYVVVDTQPPVVRVTGVRVTPGPDRRPQVEIAWEAADPNLLADPVTLEYALDPAATKWELIKARLDNNAGRGGGRYVWEVPDDGLWKLYVRARAVDKASNSRTHVWSDKGPDGPPTPVIVDLEVPAATINGVKPGGSSDAPLPAKLP